MKKLAALLWITVLLLGAITPAAFAQTQQEALGACPPGFELHEFGEHTDHEEHHIGIARDINGDGFVCVKHLNNGLHVHVDNRLPLE